MSNRDISEAALADLIAAFYALARVDPLLGPVFAEAITDWPPHLAAITDFWCATMLGARRYSGNAFAAHARHPLTPPMFERWLALWAETAEAMFAPEPARLLVERAHLIADSLRAGLFGMRPN